jgi:hypothetical protein
MLVSAQVIGKPKDQYGPQFYLNGLDICYHKNMSSTQKPKRRTALAIANTFGTLGYFSVLLQWTWALLLICYPFLTADHSFLLPDAPVHPLPSVDNAVATSPITTIIAVAATAFVLVITVVVVARLPKQIGKSGAKLTHQTADTLIPIVTKHKPLPKKKQRALSYRLTLILKTAFTIAPVLGLFWVKSPYPLTAPVIWTIGLFCAGWSVIYFAAQQAIGLFAKIDTRALW